MEAQVEQLSAVVDQLKEQLLLGQQYQQALHTELLSSNERLTVTQQQLSEHHRILEANNRARGQSLKLPKPAVFTGHKRDPTPQNWVHSMENYLTANNVDLEGTASVQVAAGYLADSALTWYRLHLSEVERGVVEAYNSWSSFKTALLKRFTPIAPEVVARSKLYHIKQTQSVQSYAVEYNNCMLDIPDMTEKDRVDRFLRGLKTDVRVLVELQKPPTLVEAIELATQIDSIMWQAHKAPIRRLSTANHTRISTGPTPMELGTAESRLRYRGRLFPSTQRSQFPQRRTTPVSGRKTIQCFYCKKAGHIQRYCLKRRRDMQNKTSGTRSSAKSD